METFERPHGKTLLARLREEPRWLIIITGPRQTGKTTLVKQVLGRFDRPSTHIAVDAPDPTTVPVTTGLGGNVTSLTTGTSLPPVDRRDARWLVRQWEEARLEAKASERGFVLALDEIQKIPNWSETVKGLWDADRLAGLPLHVILLGSAPLLMQRGLTESLAGRYEVLRLTHWSLAEMAAAFDFDLDRYLYFGGYPGPAPIVRDQSRWRSFINYSLIEPNLERDILALQRVDKPVLLKRLFELASGYSGQILSYNKMLGQLDGAGNTTTLARYLDLLSSAGLITGLSKYASRLHRRRASSPKLNVLNTALMSVHSDYTFATGSSRSGILGSIGGERRGRAPGQHRPAGVPGLLLEGQQGDERWTSSWNMAASSSPSRSRAEGGAGTSVDLKRLPRAFPWWSRMSSGRVVFRLRSSC